MISLASPDLDDDDIKAVEEVLRTSTLSLGPAGPAFENAMAAYVGARHAVAVSSGTAGLHLIVKALGIGDGDEVITTPFSFVASTNCFLFEGARPVFVDIDPVTWNIDTGALEQAVTPRTRAILPVHVFGRPCNMTAVNAVAKRHGLRVIEDSCESLGSATGGRKTGNLGTAGIFAFYPNKQITTGEGGVIITDDDELAAACRSLRNQGRSTGDSWLQHERLGYNYRLSDIQSALGRSQLGKIESFIDLRQQVVDRYAEALSGLPGVHIPAPAAPGDRVSWFVYVIRLADEFDRDDRNAVLAELQTRGIGCRDYFQPIHLQPYIREQFGTRAGDFPVTEHVADRTIALPFFNRLDGATIDAVAAGLREALETVARRKTAG